MNCATPPGSFAGLGGNPNLDPSTSGTTTMSGMSGAGIVSPLTVVDAAMGGGPWQGFSNTLDKWGGGTEPSSTNIAGYAINELARQLGLDFKFTGKGATAQKNRLLATATSRLSGFPLYLPRDAMVRFLPDLQDKISRRMAIENASAAPGFRPEPLKGLSGRQRTGAIRRNYKKEAEAKLNKKLIDLARTTGNKNYLGGKGTGQPKVISQEDLKKQITQEVFDNFLSKGVNVYGGLSLEGATQEQPLAQEQPTQEQSLAENAFNAFKGIGIGSAIVRNVFNPKRLPRPDLGWGQKLFSRQY